MLFYHPEIFVQDALAESLIFWSRGGWGSTPHPHHSLSTIFEEEEGRERWREGERRKRRKDEPLLSSLAGSATGS